MQHICYSYMKMLAFQLMLLNFLDGIKHNKKLGVPVIHVFTGN